MNLLKWLISGESLLSNMDILDLKYLPEFKYEVDTRHFDEATMSISHWIKSTRYYMVKQDVSNFPDNKMRRNFKLKN